MILKLTVLQQINLESAIRSQRGKADDEDMMTNYALLQKVRVPKEEKVAYVREFQTPQGTGAELIMKSILAAPDSSVDLETAEIRRLQSILRDASIGPDDYEWLIPLKENLLKIDSGVAAMTKKKQPTAVPNKEAV